MQAASYLYSLAHPELIASIQLLFFWPLPYGNYRKSTSILAIHVVYLAPKLLNQYLTMVCLGIIGHPCNVPGVSPDWLGLSGNSVVMSVPVHMVYPGWLKLAFLTP